MFPQKRLDTGVILAVGEFNFGCVNTLKLNEEAVNSFSVSIAQKRNNRRLTENCKRSSVEWKKSRNAKSFSKIRQNLCCWGILIIYCSFQLILKLKNM